LFTGLTKQGSAEGFIIDAWLGGFFKTFLLRRVGSIIYAGKISAEKMLEGYENN
jgi:hypothetical protein